MPIGHNVLEQEVLASRKLSRVAEGLAEGAEGRDGGADAVEVGIAIVEVLGWSGPLGERRGQGEPEALATASRALSGSAQRSS